MAQHTGWLSVFIVLLTACGSPPGIRSGTDLGTVDVVWETTVLDAHPLTGRLWSSRSEKFVTPKEMIDTLRQTPVVLVGERHDHPDHHRIQGWILSQLEPGAVVGFEMLDENDVEPVSTADSADGLRTTSKWSESGWPSFEIYRPVFEAVYRNGHRVAAVHPSRARLRALMMGPTSRSTENLTLTDALTPKGLKALRDDIVEGHCGHATPPIVEAMVKAQRFKDRWMTTRLREAAGDKRAVLIAGNGHIRRDYGVPNEFSTPVQSVALLEVRGDREQVKDYAPALYDWVWFTPRVDEIDPCEKFKKQLQRIRKKTQKKAAQ